MKIFGNKKKGFTMVEVLVFLFIFVITAMSFYKAFSVATAYTLESKNRLAATHIANEKMEIIRSLEYADIGTKKPDGSGGWTYGIPGGDILEFETVTKNTRTFYVHIIAKYVDDPFDSLATGSPADSRPADYKEVRVQVSWDPDYLENKSAFLVTRFVPPGVEDISTGGILYVNVQDNVGAPISGASVRLQNANTGIDQTNQTEDGNVMFPEVPQDLNPNYRITVSKDGLFSVHTYPIFDPSVPGSFDPIDKDTTVTAGAIWQTVITTDLESDLEIRTRDLFGNIIPNVEFSLEGGRKMGVADPTVTPLVPVYSFSQSGLDSGTEGNLAITDPAGISSGIYKFTPTTFPANFEFVKMGSALSASNEFYLQPGANASEDALFVDKEVNSILITVLNNLDSTPLQGASVNVKSTLLGYDSTVETDQFGMAFFSKGSDPLDEGNYDITVSLSGYQDKSSSISISGGLGVMEIKLDAS